MDMPGNGCFFFLNTVFCFEFSSRLQPETGMLSLYESPQIISSFTILGPKGCNENKTPWNQKWILHIWGFDLSFIRRVLNAVLNWLCFVKCSRLLRGPFQRRNTKNRNEPNWTHSDWCANNWWPLAAAWTLVSRWFVAAVRFVHIAAFKSAVTRTVDAIALI